MKEQDKQHRAAASLLFFLETIHTTDDISVVIVQPAPIYQICRGVFLSKTQGCSAAPIEGAVQVCIGFPARGDAFNAKNLFLGLAIFLPSGQNEFR